MKPEYQLTGRFASRATFAVPADLLSPSQPEHAAAVTLPRLSKIAVAVPSILLLIVTLCAMGRPGA
jgi:hypothetical protein